MRFSLAATVLVLFVGLPLFSLGAQEQEQQSDFGSLRGFDSIENSTAADLEIRVGDSWAVRASGDRRLLDQVKLSVRSGTLVIERKNPLRPLPRNARALFEVQLPELRSLGSAGSGNARVSGEFDGADLRLSTSGSGNLEVSGEVGDLELAGTGSGSIRFSGRGRDVSLHLTGSGGGDIELSARTLDVSLTGSGSLVLQGDAGDGTFHLTGSGGIRGRDFILGRVEVTISGSGSAELGVQDDLRATLTGSGGLVYSGSPQTDVRTTGSGRVRQAR